jgi:hypothetical protein
MIVYCGLDFMSWQRCGNKIDLPGNNYIRYHEVFRLYYFHTGTITPRMNRDTIFVILLIFFSIAPPASVSAVGSEAATMDAVTPRPDEIKFGSARIPYTNTTTRRLQDAAALATANPSDPALQRKVKIARRIIASRTTMK